MKHIFVKRKEERVIALHRMIWKDTSLEVMPSEAA